MARHNGRFHRPWSLRRDLGYLQTGRTAQVRALEQSQCDERALLLAFIAVGMSVLAAVLLEKLLA